MRKPSCTIAVIRGLVHLVGLGWEELTTTRSRCELISEWGSRSVHDMERAYEWVDDMARWSSWMRRNKKVLP